jgi:DNA-binding transcriptional ArsR family regulator
MDGPVLTRSCVLFGALANPTRLEIVELLLEGERSVGDVAAAVAIGQSGASQHLAHLARAGVIVATRRGSTRLYRVRGPRIRQIMATIEEFCRVHGLYGQGDEEDVEAEAIG